MHVGASQCTPLPIWTGPRQLKNALESNTYGKPRSIFEPEGRGFESLPACHVNQVCDRSVEPQVPGLRVCDGPLAPSPSILADPITYEDPIGDPAELLRHNQSRSGHMAPELRFG